MNFAVRAAIASAALAATAGVAIPASAADLYGGSIKDGPAIVAPQRAAAGPCYFRSDVGYSVSNTPDVRWPVTDPNTNNFLTDKVNKADMENTWLVEGGLGCGSGSYGFRSEIVLGYRGARDIKGEPGNWAPAVPVQVDPLHTTLTTYTAMFNVYKDLGRWGAFTPYVGAGLGMAYHVMDDVHFTDNNNLTSFIHGKSDLAFAWQLMAGLGYQVSDRTILDFGYRYVDLGKATSERHDTAFFVNPRINVNDITAHEFKVGLRYHFGQSDCCASYAPMK